jgi:hypothetical protein
MNSFKKIALAMVAAMTLGTVVATPASAAVMTVAVSLNGSANSTNSAIATPASLPVPEDNKIDATDALKFVATVDTGTAVTVTTTNATIVTALHTDAAPVGSTSGSSTLTVATGTGVTATFWVYTKTTAIGTVVIANGGTTLTYYVQGTAGKVNTLSLASADAGTTSSVVTATATATDVFGNKVAGIGLTALVVGGTLDTTTATSGATLTTFGSADFKVTLPATGQSTLVVRVTDTTANGAVAVAGFNTPVTSAVKTITVRDLLGELAAQKAIADAAVAAKALADAAVAKAAVDAVAAKAASDAAVAKATADAVDAKTAADKALADAKVASDKALADAKIAADASLKAEVDKAAAAKVASDAALAAKDAEIAKLTADNAKALASLKKAFNTLANKWNKKNPKAKVTLVK